VILIKGSAVDNFIVVCSAEINKCTVEWLNIPGNPDYTVDIRLPNSQLNSHEFQISSKKVTWMNLILCVGSVGRTTGKSPLE